MADDLDLLLKDRPALPPIPGPVAADQPVRDPKKKYEQHEWAIEKGAECKRCPLYGCGEGPVKSQIVVDAKLAFVGEAPGLREVESGENFVGASGDVLNECLADEGVSRRSVTIVNSLLCRPPNGLSLQAYVSQLKFQHKLATERYAAAKARGEPHLKPPFALVLPAEACLPRLTAELNESNSTTICAVGGEALRAVAKYTGTPYGTQKVAPGTPRLSSMKKQRGAPLPIPDGRTICSSFHPAFAMRGSPHMMPVVKDDLRRAIRISQRDGRIEWSEPPFILDPTADVAVNVIDMLLREGRNGVRTTLDIETNDRLAYKAQIRCIGLGAVVDEKELLICVPWRFMANGRFTWTPATQVRIKNVLLALLDGAPLGGQNLAYDTVCLLAEGFMTDREKVYFDTMLAHHNTHESELQHDLGFLISRKFESPRHKEDADQKSIEGVNDRLLWTYNLKDVLSTMRLIPPLLRDVQSDGMWESFLTDTHLAPAARDMGLLGLNINEKTRRQFYDRLSQVIKTKTAALREITGDPEFNPNSFRQVAKFLYVDQRLTPPFDSEGKDWAGPAAAEYDEDEELDDEDESLLERASTNELSLLRLLDLGVDEKSRKFIDTELEFRGSYKINSSYIGLKDEGGTLVDKHRTRGTIVDEYRPSITASPLSIFHSSWKLQTVPSGRWASTPNSQNWAERAVYDVALYHKHAKECPTCSKGKACLDPDKGIINTRGMVEAPPGYTFVGADYCLTGETPIVTSGGNKPIASVHVGDLILACNPAGELAFKKATAAACVGTAFVYEMVLEDGSRVKCTGDHKWMTRDGVMRETKLLQPGDRLMHVREGAAGTSNYPTWHVWSNRQYRYKHHLIADALYGPRTLDVQVDHIDGDSQNWNESNLRLLPRAENAGQGPGRWWKKATEAQRATRLHQLAIGREGRRSYVGAGNPNFGKSRKEERICTICADVFIANPSEDKVCCSRSCGAVMRWRNRRAQKASDGTNHRVESVTLVGEEPVYQITVEDWHTYVLANGLVSGNSQIELRLYAEFAGDQLLLEAIANGMDPHSWNFACLMAKTPERQWEAYLKLEPLPPRAPAAAHVAARSVVKVSSRARKHSRNIAKRFCIAEGTPILTKRGLVPIERVLLSDVLWDGVEWVGHDGVIFQGYKEVIEYDGLSATADHKIWLEDGRQVEFGIAAARRALLARSGAGRYPIRFMGDVVSSVGLRQDTENPGSVYGLRCHSHCHLGESARRFIEELHEGPAMLPLAQQAKAARLVVAASDVRQAALRERTQPWMEELLRPWDSVCLRVDRGCSRLDDGEPRPAGHIGQGNADRQDRQQQALRARQSSYRPAACESDEQADHQARSELDILCEGLAVQPIDCPYPAVQRLDPRRDSGAGSTCGGEETEDVATNRRVVRVYDILNAGPRRRFTAAGKLVSNCYLIFYGGQREKLYSTMAADRNPDGTRSFPELTPAQVFFWFDNWHLTHPWTRAWQHRVCQGWMSHGVVRSIIDNRGRFFLGGMDQTAIPNHRIQSSAGSIMNRAMTAIVKACPYRGWGEMAGAILQVHDAVVLQVPLAQQQAAEDLIQQTMPYRIGDLEIPIELKSANTWADV